MRKYQIFIICLIPFLYSCAGKVYKSYFDKRKHEPIIVMQDIAEEFGFKCQKCHLDDELNEFGKRMKKKMFLASSFDLMCESCHLEGGKLSKLGEISRAMFEISNNMGVECKFCHKEKNELTSKGLKSKREFKKAAKINKKCIECHRYKKQFELNRYGEMMKDLR